MTPNRSNSNPAGSRPGARPDARPDTRQEARPKTQPDTQPDTRQFAAPQPIATSLESRIAGVLRQPPQVRIPADFAARVAQRAVAQPEPRPARLNGWGPRVAVGSGALLTLALFALAPHAAPSLTSARFDAELVVLAELSTLLLFAPRLLRRD